MKANSFRKMISGTLATIVLTASFLGSIQNDAYANSGTSLYSQNQGFDPIIVDALKGGYEEGAYDKNAVVPVNPYIGSTIVSRFQGVDVPQDKVTPGRWRLALSSKSKISSPVIGADNTLYVTTDDNKLIAVNPNGTIKWTLNNITARYAPVIREDGVILVINNDRMMGINPTGTVNFSFPVNGGIFALGKDGTIYVINGLGSSGTLTAYTSSGSLKWSHNLPGNPQQLVINGEGNIVISLLDLQGEGTLYVVSPTGSMVWKRWVTDTADYIRQLSIGPDGSIYGVSNNSRELYSYSKGGTRQWVKRGYDFYGQVYLGPEGNIYAPDIYAGTYIFSPAGTQIGEIPMVVTGIDSNGILYGTGGAYDELDNKWQSALIKYPQDSLPVIGKDGTVYAADGKYLNAIGKIQLPDNQSTISDHLLTVESDTGTTAAFAYNTSVPVDISGTLQWRVSADGFTFSNVSPTTKVINGKVTAEISGLSSSKGYEVQALYTTSYGRTMVYQRAILRPELYTGDPITSDDFQAPIGQEPYPVPVTPPTISIQKTVIRESATNDGSVTEQQIVTLTDGIFVTDVSDGVTVNNLPAGLGISVTRDGDKQISISFTGKATSHASANNVTNASITIDKSKIIGATEDLTSSYFAFEFQDNQPAVVSNFRHTAVTQTTATLAWDAVSNAETYVITNPDGVQVYTGAGTSTQIAGLTPNTSYTFTIIARNVYGDSSAATATVTTLGITNPTVETVKTTKTSVSFEIREVEGATKYVVSRNPEWTYESAGGTRYDVTWKNTATGEGPTTLDPVYSVGGKITHTEAGLTANTPYSYTVTAMDSNGNASAPQTVQATTAPLSSVADLQSIQITQGTLNPTFDSDTVSYTATVAYNVSSVNVLGTPVDDNATVTVNGTAQNGTAVNVDLQVGANPISIEVTSEDGQTTRQYTVTITREEATFGTFDVNASSVTQDRATLTWNNLGSGVTYTVDLSPEDGTATVNGQNASLTDLKPSTSYTATVTASKSGYTDKQATTTFTTLAPVSDVVKKPTVQSVRLVDANTLLFTIESLDGESVKVNNVTREKSGTSTTFEVSVPAGTGTQTFTITALRGGTESEPVIITVNIPELANKMVNADSIKIENYLSAAKVSWDAVDGATRYRVELLRDGLTTPVAYTVSSPSTPANISYGDYDVTVYVEYQGVWGSGVTKRVTYAAPPPVGQNPTDFQAVDGSLPGSKVLTWKGTSGIQTIALVQNGTTIDSKDTRFLTVTFYNLKNGEYDVYIAGIHVGSFTVSSGSGGDDSSGGGNTETPRDLVVTDGTIAGSKVVSWAGTTKIVTVELKQDGQTIQSQQTRFTNATFYNLGNGEYEVYVAGILLGTFTVSSGSGGDDSSGGGNTETPRDLVVTDGTIAGSKVVSWAGTTKIVAVELKQNGQTTHSQQTRFTSATFYNLTNGQYEVYVAGTLLGSFEVTNGSGSDNPGGEGPTQTPKNLQVSDGTIRGSKLVQWEGTSGVVTVELKVGTELKASVQTRFLSTTFYKLQANSYDVYVAGVHLGSFEVTSGEAENPGTGEEPVDVPRDLVVTDGVNGTKIVSWQGTTKMVTVELKQDNIVNAQVTTRFTSATFTNLAVGTYDVLVDGTYIGSFTVEGSSAPETPTSPTVPTNLTVTNGAVATTKILSWEGTNSNVVVELKQDGVVKASQSTRFTSATFVNLAEGTYEVYVANTLLGTLTVTLPAPEVPIAPNYNPVLEVTSPTYKKLSWEGTSGTVTVELKDGEQIVKSASTRFTYVSLYQLPDKLYRVFISGNFAGYVSIHSKYRTPTGEAVSLVKGQFIYDATKQPFTGDVKTLTVVTEQNNE